jgi:hypothetical protein
LKPDQWFTLWITLLSVALRGNRRSLRQERALTAAEQCLAAVDKAFEEYRQIALSLKWSSEDADAHMSESIVERIMKAFDNFANSEVGHEAWLLENRDITFSIAECLRSSMQLHLDSFTAAMPELQARVDLLSSQLWNAGELLRASLLGKPISELTERDRTAIGLLLPGRHIRKGSQ